MFSFRKIALLAASAAAASLFTVGTASAATTSPSHVSGGGGSLCQIGVDCGIPTPCNCGVDVPPPTVCDACTTELPPPVFVSDCGCSLGELNFDFPFRSRFLRELSGPRLRVGDFFNFDNQDLRVVSVDGDVFCLEDQFGNFVFNDNRHFFRGRDELFSSRFDNFNRFDRFNRFDNFNRFDRFNRDQFRFRPF